METQIKELYKPLFSYVKKRINNREDAEDLTQEVFYKLSKSNLDSVNSIQNWIYVIAKNTITDYYRKKKNYTEDIAELYSSLDETIEDKVNELSKCVIPFIKDLPEEYRFLVTLSEIEGVSQKEIAEKLNMNYVTVRSKIQRGRKKLKGIFLDCCKITQGGKGSILDYEQKKKLENKNNCCDDDKH